MKSLTRRGAASRILLLMPMLCGFWFLFADLGAIGFTYDEEIDYRISSEILVQRDAFANLDDPSQSRLPHLIAAVGMRIGGAGLLSFKRTFAIVGVCTAALVLLVATQYFGGNIALFAAGLFMLCPYTLAAYRTAATGGDGLVLTTWLIFTIVVSRWLEVRRWTWALAAGASLGLAIGAKFTAIALAPIALLRMFFRKPGDNVHVIAGEIAVVFGACFLTALLANPLLWLGPDHLEEILRDLRLWDSVPEIIVFGRWEERHPFYYVPAVFLSKLTPPLILLAIAGAWFAVREVRRFGTPVEPLVVVSVAVIAASLIAAFRQNQNAHYYVGSVGPVVFLGARALRRETVRGTRVLVAMASLGLLFLLDLGLKPDFLQAGRIYGSAFQGEFNGPAVNHCQGGPYLVGRLMRAGELSPGDTLYVLDECQEPLQAGCLAGASPCATVFMYEDAVSRKPRVVIVPRLYLVSRINREEAARRRDALERIRRSCRRIDLQVFGYDIFGCDS